MYFDYLDILSFNMGDFEEGEVLSIFFLKSIWFFSKFYPISNFISILFVFLFILSYLIGRGGVYDFFRVFYFESNKLEYDIYEGVRNGVSLIELCNESGIDITS